MNRPILAVVLFALMLGAGPLLAQNSTELNMAKELPDVDLPPELDRVIRDFERAWHADDVVALASLFTEDGFVLQSNRPPARGRTAIQAAYKGQGGGRLRLRALAFASGDTTAYIIGGYGYGNEPGDIGKFTLTLRRAPGEQWLIFSDMDNSNAKPRRENAPDTPSPTESPAAGH